jgi:hypothetical protein
MEWIKVPEHLIGMRYRYVDQTSQKENHVEFLVSMGAPEGSYLELAKLNHEALMRFGFDFHGEKYTASFGSIVGTYTFMVSGLSLTQWIVGR